MISLILAVAFFVGIHLFISGTSLRDTLVEHLGEKPYMAIFSVLSFIGLFWMISAYHNAPHIELWGQILAARSISSLLIMIAFLFLVLGLLSPNPTVIGGEALLKKAEPAQGIIRITRHPFLVGFAVWAATHMIYNGDLSSNIFFGGFLILSICGPKSIDNKQRQNCGEDWQRFADETSIIPFIAIIQKRNTLQWKELLTWRLLAALVVYVAVFKLHEVMFGVSPVITGG